jgi:hypothetical protein
MVIYFLPLNPGSFFMASRVAADVELTPSVLLAVVTGFELLKSLIAIADVTG